MDGNVLEISSMRVIVMIIRGRRDGFSTTLHKSGILLGGTITISSVIFAP